LFLLEFNLILVAQTRKLSNEVQKNCFNLRIDTSVFKKNTDRCDFVELMDKTDSQNYIIILLSKEGSNFERIISNFYKNAVEDSTNQFNYKILSIKNNVLKFEISSISKSDNAFLMLSTVFKINDTNSLLITHYNKSNNLGNKNPYDKFNLVCNEILKSFVLIN
jgi:hypothetical protein